MTARRRSTSPFPDAIEAVASETGRAFKPFADEAFADFLKAQAAGWATRSSERECREAEKQNQAWVETQTHKISLTLRDVRRNDVGPVSSCFRTEARRGGSLTPPKCGSLMREANLVRLDPD